ncbi:hypothetical protein BK147_29905, partial [Paenibacillus sp. FSL R7-0337]|uniref:hypothetical protein n=1 Tax=Paenibacillus sp. FSL R7-0337 TaxID=1926588 RepID=UPI00097BA037
IQPINASSFFNFFFELGVDVSRPEIEYITDRDSLQALFLNHLTRAFNPPMPRELPEQLS